jgi:hypothetical protein
MLSALLQRAREEQSVKDLDVHVDASRDEIIANHSPTPEEPSLSSEPVALAVPDADTATTDAESVGSVTRPQLVARPMPQKNRRVYPRVELGDATANQGCFFDEDYSETLRSMAMSVLESHGPIREDVLAREVARAHGFARTGNRVKQRVLKLLANVTFTEEPVGRFLWPNPSAQEVVPFRYPPDDGERRSLDEIAMPELLGLVREHPALAAGDDAALALAREIGLARLAQAARERLEEALEACDNDR